MRSQPEDMLVVQAELRGALDSQVKLPGMLVVVVAELPGAAHSQVEGQDVLVAPEVPQAGVREAGVAMEDNPPKSHLISSAV